MEVLYLDRLFAVNGLIDYCVLLAAARVCGVALRRRRYALAALLGAVYAALTVLPGWTWLAAPALKLALGAAMALIAFGGEERLGRCTAVFFAVAALFCGGVYAASLLAGADPLRGALAPLTWRVFALSFAVCWFVVSVAFRRRMQRADRELRPVTVTFGGKEARLTGLRDSGNDLHDPATGRAAAVADRAAVAALLDLGGVPDDPAAAMVTLSGRPALRGRLCLLPYRAVGVPGGLLLAFRPDRVEVDGRAEDLLIALSGAPLGDGDCRILLPPR